MAMSACCGKMLRDPEIGKLIVPIVQTKRARSVWNRSFEPPEFIPASARQYQPSTSTP